MSEKLNISKSPNFKVHKEDILADLNGGCITIFPQPIDLQVCYTWNGSEACLKVKLQGHVIGQGCVSAANPCVNYSVNLGVVKASIKLCLKGNCITYDAKACYWAITWHCTSDHGNLICF